MPLSESLAKSFGDLTDTLFGSGQQEYYKGGLMRSRMGASDALTRHRGLQSRDLETAYGERQSLLAELLAQSQQQGAGPAAGMKYDALRSGKRMTDYTTAGINTADFASKLQAMEAMKTAVGPEGNPLFDQRTLLGLQAGQKGGEASLMSQRLATTPHRVQGLSDANILAQQLGKEQLGKAGYENQQAGIEFKEAMTKAETTQQKLDILQDIFTKFNLSMEKAENIPSGLTGTDADGNEFEMSLADWARIQGGPRSGKPATGVLKFGVAAGDVKELASEKVKKIKKEIEKLGFDIDKTKALTKLYEARESDIKAGKVNGNISFTQAGALYRELMGKRHKNDAGRRVRWEDLTVKEQRRLYNEGVNAIRSGAMNLGGGSSTGSTLGDKLSDTSDQDRLTDLDNFIKNKKD